MNQDIKIEELKEISSNWWNDELSINEMKSLHDKYNAVNNWYNLSRNAILEIYIKEKYKKDDENYIYVNNYFEKFGINF